MPTTLNLSVSDQLVLSDSLQYILKLKDPTLSFAETLSMQDSFGLVLGGAASAPLVIVIGERLVMSDSFPTPIARVTQSAIEIVQLPTDAKARLTQAPVEVVFLATDAKARLTQCVVEVVAQRPAGSFTGTQIQLRIQ